MSKIQRISRNTRGRDFICSDIHGHFHLLAEKLEQVSFDSRTDRLFCLGDLIDRSADSPRVLEYLEQPWFYSILGNHEIMLMEVYESGDPSVRQQWHFWGGDWAEDLDEDELAVYYEKFIHLPLAIELQLADGKSVGLVHANLPDEADWNEVKARLAVLPAGGFNSYEPLLRDMLWNKAPLYENDSLAIEPVRNIDHVFHGHTIVDDYVLLENRTYMDLGSYERHELGFLQPLAYLQHMA